MRGRSEHDPAARESNGPIRSRQTIVDSYQSRLVVRMPRLVEVDAVLEQALDQLDVVLCER
jgi:hypothetical protein